MILKFLDFKFVSCVNYFLIQICWKSVEKIFYFYLMFFHWAAIKSFMELLSAQNKGILIEETLKLVKSQKVMNK